MNNLQIEARINSIAPYIRYRSGDNEDLFQEGNIAVMQALQTDENATDNFIKRKIEWNIVNFLRKGRSVDNGGVSYQRKNPIKIIHHSQISYDILEDKKQPVDEQALNRICIERLFAKLTEAQKRFIFYKLDGWTDKKIVKKLQVPVPKLREMKGEIRFQISQAFAE